MIENKKQWNITATLLKMKNYNARNKKCGKYHVFFQKQWPGGVLLEKVFLEISQNSQENTSTRVSFSIKLQAEACKKRLWQKETLGRVFSCEFCKISKNILFYRTPPVAALFFILLPPENMYNKFRKVNFSAIKSILTQTMRIYPPKLSKLSR